MSKRSVNLISGSACLLTGGMLYVLFRPNTIVAKLFSGFPFVKNLQIWFASVSCDLFRYYFTDFLWGYSLTCGLSAILSDSCRNAFISGICGFLCGVIWELLQFAGIVPGTGDFWDIGLYFCGSALSVILNIRREQNEKN